MATEAFPFDAVLGAYRQSQFNMTDFVRRLQGDVIGAFGFDPIESPYRLVSSGSFWRLRDYSEHSSGQPLLIIAAPIKRPYIWDLIPSASAIRTLTRSFRVRLLEWLPASQATTMNGLKEYTQAISTCAAQIFNDDMGVKPFLMGHSLGGTLAAIFAASSSGDVEGLVLLSAPVCFRPKTSHFRDALISLVPTDLVDAGPFPGSLLSHMSALASPETFLWSRLADLAFSIMDNQALEILARIERWALDEVPLPGKLVREIIESLYRVDQFCRGDLRIGEAHIGPFTLLAPTLAVVNTADNISPLASVKAFIDAMPRANGQIIEYSGETGVCLQHLGILVGKNARQLVWPEIVTWMSHVQQNR